MSGAAQTRTEEEGADRGDGQTPEEAERFARLLGWKPKEDFKGDPARWTSAEQFIQVMGDRPAVAMERLQTMSGRMERMDRDYRRQLTEVSTRLGEAVETIGTLTDLSRTAEQRAYERARRELRTEQEKAVTDGDTARFRQLASDLDNLDATRPVSPPVRQEQTQPSAGGRPAGVPVTPEANRIAAAADAFRARNAWYTRNLDLQKEADRYHFGLQATDPDMSIEDNLAAVEAHMRQRFADQIGERPPSRRTDGHDPNETPPARRQSRQSDDEEGDTQSGMVTPSSGSDNRRPRTQRFTFDAMPQESKQSYERYKTQLSGKGEPLTKEEWANYYWEKDKAEAGV